MGSNVAVAYQHHPEAFIARFCDQDAPLRASGLPVLCGKDFVVINTPHAPSVTVAFALAEVERALPGLHASSEAVAVGLGGGSPLLTTTFAEWTEHWIRGNALRNNQQPVARAMFGAVAASLLPREVPDQPN